MSEILNLEAIEIGFAEAINRMQEALQIAESAGPFSDVGIVAFEGAVEKALAIKQENFRAVASRAIVNEYLSLLEECISVRTIYLRLQEKKEAAETQVAAKIKAEVETRKISEKQKQYLQLLQKIVALLNKCAAAVIKIEKRITALDDGIKKIEALLPKIDKVIQELQSAKESLKSIRPTEKELKALETVTSDTGCNAAKDFKAVLAQMDSSDDKIDESIIALSGAKKNLEYRKAQLETKKQTTMEAKQDLEEFKFDGFADSSIDERMLEWAEGLETEFSDRLNSYNDELSEHDKVIYEQGVDSCEALIETLKGEIQSRERLRENIKNLSKTINDKGSYSKDDMAKLKELASQYDASTNNIISIGDEFKAISSRDPSCKRSSTLPSFSKFSSAGHDSHVVSGESPSQEKPKLN